MFMTKQPADSDIDNRTWYTCPHCGYGSAFFNEGAPDECEECMGGLPDYLRAMKQVKIRKAYFVGGYLGTWEVGTHG